MLESLRSWPLLKGYRGTPPVQVDKLIEVLIRLSYLVADFPEIQEFDVNPLFVSPDETIALDARIVLSMESKIDRPIPFSHLAIRPYPVEYVRSETLPGNLRVLLRPIKPEDESMWKELVLNCSSESLWFRFQYMFKEANHPMASRFCFLDYDREMAIVAEVEVGDQRRIVGVGRLAADADHTNAEYAVLVCDAFQGKGLGTLLTNYCLEICNEWGISAVTAWVAADNRRMQSILRHRGFALQTSDEPNVLKASYHVGKSNAKRTDS
jgi:acetyltransferase